MQDLQDLGEELAELSGERLKKLDLPEQLRDALKEAQRRQLQYIGKLMRDIDAAPIREALAALKGESATEVARMHRIERLRIRLLEDEKTLAEIAENFPGADLQHLRTLRRSALKEQEAQKPPRSYRAIFQMLKELDAAAGANDGND